MRRLLRIVFLVYLFAWAELPCLAGPAPLARDIFVDMPSPRYPMEAGERRSDGWRLAEGVTVCRLYLDAKGAVTNVRIIKSSGNKYLDAAGMEALRQWRAKPGPPGRSFNVPINFERDSPKPPIIDGLGMTKGSDVGK